MNLINRLARLERLTREQGRADDFDGDLDAAVEREIRRVGPAAAEKVARQLAAEWEGRRPAWRT